MILDNRATIAGGALRSLLEGNDPRDIDIFLTKKKNFQDVWDLLAAYTGKEGKYGSGVVHFGDMYTLVLPYKVGKRKLWGKPAKLVEAFDIDITQLWMSPEGTIASRYLEDIEQSIMRREFKLTHFDNTKQKVAVRVAKYVSYGYKLVGIDTSYNGYGNGTIRQDVHGRLFYSENGLDFMVGYDAITETVFMVVERDEELLYSNLDDVDSVNSITYYAKIAKYKFGVKLPGRIIAYVKREMK